MQKLHSIGELKYGQRPKPYKFKKYPSRRWIETNDHKRETSFKNQTRLIFLTKAYDLLYLLY